MRPLRKSLQMFLAIAALCLVMARAAGAAATTAAPAANEATAHVSEAANKGGEADAGKAEHQGGLLDPDLGTAFFTIIIFVALLIILRATAWKPIMGGLKTRENAIRDSIEAAAKAKTEAERTMRELEAKMSEAQKQAAGQLQQARADAQKIADTIRTQAESESAALKDRTLREIEAAKQQAVTEINAHAAELGTAIARKILQRDINTGDQQQLVDQSLAELAKKN